MKHPSDAVARNLKKIRESRGLSFDQLSALTGVSKSMLRQIETGNSSPTISTIWKIANGVKVSFTTLLEQKTDVSVKSFKGDAPLTGENEHYRLFPLVSFEPGRPIETYYVEIDPGTTFHGEPHEGNVEEYLFVLSGCLKVEIDGREFLAEAQQFIQFQADRPHRYSCTGSTTASFIMQVNYAG